MISKFGQMEGPAKSCPPPLNASFINPCLNDTKFNVDYEYRHKDWIVLHLRKLYEFQYLQNVSLKWLIVTDALDFGVSTISKDTLRICKKDQIYKYKCTHNVVSGCFEIIICF